MQQRIVHGAFVDMLTPDELYKAIKRPERKTRIRVPYAIELDAAGSTGNAPFPLYKVPIGASFEARRINFELGNVNGLNIVTASISLATVGPPTAWIEYLRSGQHIEWAYPISPLGSNLGRVPGIQTWGDEQGPFISNGDVFQINCALTAASAGTSLSGVLEGILTENNPDA